jgi:hypothetical protein
MRYRVFVECEGCRTREAFEVADLDYDDAKQGDVNDGGLVEALLLHTTHRLVVEVQPDPTVPLVSGGEGLPSYFEVFQRIGTEVGQRVGTGPFDTIDAKGMDEIIRTLIDERIKWFGKMNIELLLTFEKKGGNVNPL